MRFSTNFQFPEVSGGGLAPATPGIWPRGRAGGRSDLEQREPLLALYFDPTIRRKEEKKECVRGGRGKEPHHAT